MQIPIVSGIVTEGTDFRTAYPVNLVPVPKVQGISEGYLRPAEGIIKAGDGPGIDRGGFRWNDDHYRVMGTSLVRIRDDGVIQTIGTIPGTQRCVFDYSFDYLAINNGIGTWLYDGATLTRITDADLGVSKDVVWIDGYFASTDGAFVVVTDLLDPFSINPLKYGSSEVSPDPVVGLQKLRNELFVVNRHTIEVFTNVGGAGFPFSRVDGAQIEKGAVSSRAVCEFAGAIAFLGGGFNEANAIWLGSSAQSTKLSSREIDDTLRQYSDAEMETVLLEARLDRGHEFLYIHLPDKTLVFDNAASAATQQPVWHILQSGAIPEGYKARGFVWCYGKWWVGNPNGTEFGYMDSATGLHYGVPAAWTFATPIIYNQSRGAIIHEIELVALTGNVVIGESPLLSTEYSLDGETWSQPKYISAGTIGERAKRLTWLRQGAFRNWRIQRFSGDTRVHVSFARIEAQIEGLSA